jgi:hypothetical protein
MTITSDQDDAPKFIAEVQNLVDGLLRTYAPPAVVILKINNWFGPRWLKFSGKALGALGVWKKRLTIPPFVPNRVVSQVTYAGASYDEIVVRNPIHIRTKGMMTLKRYVEDVAPGAAIIWYSGRSGKSGQGSMMAYVPSTDDYLPLYVRWVIRDSWRVSQAIGITAEDVLRLSQSVSVPFVDPIRDASPSV